jgi:hypothetical protein
MKYSAEYFEEGRKTMYDVLYKKASNLMRKYNPCNVKNGMCARGQSGEKNFCCSGCHHLTENGCDTQALFCKLWICPFLEEILPKKIKKEINKVFEEVDKYDLAYPRADKKETLNRKDYGTAKKRF